MASLESKNNNADTILAALDVNLLDCNSSTVQRRMRSATVLELYTSDFYLVQQACVDAQLLKELVAATRREPSAEENNGSERSDDADDNTGDADDLITAAAANAIPFWTYWPIIIIIVSSAAASLLLYAQLRAEKPGTVTTDLSLPCQMTSNPNHLIPCALFNDMNRLLQLSDMEGFRDWFPPRTLQDFEPFKKDEYLPFARAIADRKAIVTQVEVEFEIDRFRRHLIPRLDFVDRCYATGWRRGLKCWLSSDYRDLSGFRTEVDGLAQGMLNNIFGPGHLDVVNRSLSAARKLLVVIEKNRYAVDVEVQRVAEIKRDGWFSDNTPPLSVILELEERRLVLERWLTAEAIFKCWIENQEAASDRHLEWIKALQSSRVTHAGSLPDDTTWIPHARTNILHITDAILDKATLSTDNSESDRRRCAEAWISEAFKHCLSTDLEQGFGCSSHPDPAWWRWHNTVDMADSSSVWTGLLRSRSDSEKKNCRQNIQNHGWTAAVETRQGLTPAEGVIKLDAEKIADIREHVAKSWQRHRELRRRWWQWRWS